MITSNRVRMSAHKQTERIVDSVHILGPDTTQSHRVQTKANLVLDSSSLSKVPCRLSSSIIATVIFFSASVDSLADIGWVTPHCCLKMRINETRMSLIQMVSKNCLVNYPLPDAIGLMKESYMSKKINNKRVYGMRKDICRWVRFVRSTSCALVF